MCGLPCREESPCLHRPESGSALLVGFRVCAGGGGRAEQSVWGSCGVQHPEPTPLLGLGWGSGFHPSPGTSGGGGVSRTGEAGGPSLLGPGPLSG